MTQRYSRELRTLAMGIDALSSGNLATAGDVLMQRFKAVEAASDHVPWEVAEKLELIPSGHPSTLSHEEKAVAIRQAKNESKVAAIFSGSPRPGPKG